MSQGANGGLLIVAGHAIFQGGAWHGGFPGEGRFYAQHARDGFGLFRQEEYAAIALSGGRTRPGLPAVTNSEGEGLLEFALQERLCAPGEPGVLVEPWARDSFENVFFSMLCFYHRYQEWPARVGVVSWKFKALRSYLIACGLRLGDGRFTFYGSGDLVRQAALEAAGVASALYDAALVSPDGALTDPLHRDLEAFGRKRLGRMPASFQDNAAYLRAVKQAYDMEFDGAGEQGKVGELLDRVERVTPGPGWRDVAWPWLS